MSDTRPIRVATLDRIADAMNEVEGIQLSQLPPLTTLLVRTVNSVYRVVIDQWPVVHVQGGEFFPEPTLACVDGARVGVGIRVGWIGIGLMVEFRAGDRRIITSPVRSIAIEQGFISHGTSF